MIGIDDVVNAVVGILESWRPQFDAALGDVAPIRIAGIYPFATNNVPIGELPLIMVAAEKESVEWVALPDIAEETFTLSIWGLAHHEEPEIGQRLLRTMGAQLKACLNHRDRLFWPVGNDGGVMYFNNRLPLGTINYGVGASLASSLVPALNAQFISNASIEPTIGSYLP